ncbi:MAG: ECF transporter S component [Halanaeroarchaeum sp.]
MTDPSGPRLDASVVAMSAVVAAAVAVATMAVSIPVGFGYLNFGEVVIYTGAFLFGRLVGGLAGGIGAAAADVILGYLPYAPITLVAKGVEGYVVGRFSGESTRSKVIAVAAGAPFMIVAYFLARWYFEGLPLAIAQELPIDLVQAVVGAAIAIPLAQALQSRVPELR